MKTLVTGANGFIGSTLVSQLIGEGHEVYALMRQSSKPSNLEGLSYHRVIGDLSDVDSLKAAVKGMDIVFHLAGVTAAKNRDEYFKHNAEGTAHLISAILESGKDLKRLVYVSSLAAAGPASSMTPKSEDELSSDAPVSFYGESKRQGELEALKHKAQIPLTIVRPPMVFGPKEKGVFLMIRTVSRNWMPIMQGATPSGDKFYSSIHSEDLCRGLIQAANCSTPSGEVFYLCSDDIHSYVDLMSTIARTLDVKPRRFQVPQFVTRFAAHAMSALSAVTQKTYSLNTDKLNEILPDYWICSNQKAKKMLGFQPRYNLSEGMAHAIDWYKDNNWI